MGYSGTASVNKGKVEIQHGGGGSGRTQISDMEVFKDLLTQALQPSATFSNPMLSPQVRYALMQKLGLAAPAGDSLQGSAGPQLGGDIRGSGGGIQGTGPAKPMDPSADYWRQGYNADFNRKQREMDARSEANTQNKILKDKLSLINSLLGGGDYNTKVVTSGDQGQFINNAGKYQLVNVPSSQTTTTYGNYKNDIQKALIQSLLG